MSSIGIGAYVHGGTEQQLEARRVLRHEYYFLVEILAEYDVDAVGQGALEDGAERRAEDRPVKQILAVEEAGIAGDAWNWYVSE